MWIDLGWLMGVTRESSARLWHHQWDFTSPNARSLAQSPWELVTSPLFFLSSRSGIDPGVSQVLRARMSASVGAGSWGLGNLRWAEVLQPRSPEPVTEL